MLKSDHFIKKPQESESIGTKRGEFHRGLLIFRRYLKESNLYEGSELSGLHVSAWFEVVYGVYGHKYFMRSRQWFVGYLNSVGREDISECVRGVGFSGEVVSAGLSGSSVSTKGSKVSLSANGKSLGGRVVGSVGSNAEFGIGFEGSGSGSFFGSDSVSSSRRNSRSGKSKSNGKVSTWVNNRVGLTASMLSKHEIDGFLDYVKSERKDGSPRYKSGGVIYMLFQLIAMTGIRPSEWTRVTVYEQLMDSEKLYGFGLSVVGAEKGQNKNKGTESLTRHLVCEHWTDYEKEMLKVFVEGISKNDEDHKVLLRDAKSALRLICKSHFGEPSALCFYDARHLYACEFRRSKYRNKFSLAAALGHSDIINQKYYGDFSEDGSDGREFEWSLAYPVEREELNVKVNAERRHERTLERLHKTFGVVSKSDREDNGLASW